VTIECSRAHRYASITQRVANILVRLCCLALAAPGAFAQDTRLTFGTGIDYSTGKYGGTLATDITYVPFLAKLEWGRWTGRVAVPWVSITGPGNVVGAVDPIVIAQQANVRRTESGLGDIVASLSYGLIDGVEGLFLDAVGKVKFGTADANKGLGTGENDYALQADVSKTIGRFSVLGTAGYRVLGDPPGVNLRNVWFGSLGASYSVAPLTSIGLILDAREAATAATADPLEITGYVSYTPHRGLRFQIYGSHGFTDGSADWGAGATLGYAF